MLKNKVVMAATGTVAVLALLASFAGAQTAATGGTAAPTVKMSVQINASGRAQLTGIVVAVQSGSFTMNSWGGRLDG